MLLGVSVGPMLVACGQLVGVGSLSGGGDSADANLPAAQSDAASPVVPEDAATDSGAAGETGATTDATNGDPDAYGDEGPPAFCYVDGEAPSWDPGAGTLAPPYAVRVGNEQVDPTDPNAGVYPIYVCRGYLDDGGPDIVPGKFVNTLGCYFTPDGIAEVAATTFDVLTDDGCLTWTPYAFDGGLPPNAFLGGQVEGHSVYVCSGAIAGDTRASGYTFGPPYGGCWVSYRGVGSELTDGLDVLTE